MTAENLILLCLAVPAIATVLIAMCRNVPNLRETVTLSASAILLVCVLSLLDDVLAGARPSVTLFEVVPGIAIAFTVEPLGMLFGLVASGLWIVNSLYSIGYMRGNDEPRQTPFYMCFGIAIASTIGVAFSANLFTLFLFYEILTLSTYPLVTHKANDEAVAGGRTYLVLLLGTSMVLLLPAIIWTWVETGTMTFAVGGILGEEPNPAIVAALLFLYAYGIGKAALMPIHFWLPAAMVAPTPVSALLHAVAVVKAGVFSIVKIVVYVFGIETLSQSGTAGWLLYVAGGTILIASIVALKADNLKRRLAYSTVSQLSYVVLATAILAPISVVGAAMHIAAHAVSKITLFFAAGSIYTAAHLTEVSQLNGIGRKMPWTMGAFCDRGAEHDRCAADGGLSEQVVHSDGRDGHPAMGRRRHHHCQHAVERGLFPARDLRRLLQGARREPRRTRSRRGALADGHRPDRDGGGDDPPVLLPSRAACALQDVGRRIIHV